jgi:signal transduction histidine kinase
MTNPPARHRLLHLAENPADTELLQQQLLHDGLDLQVDRAATAAEMATAVTAGVDLVVADLPLPWPGAEADLLHAQTAQPRLSVVFRWGLPGSWQVDDPTEQIGRAVANALSLQTRPLDGGLRKHDLEQHARLQGVLLQMSRLDFWDFEATLHQVTSTFADLYQVERVSVWEFADDGVLTCLDLFTRGTRRHTAGDKVARWPRYLKALESSLSIAARDAYRDLRTSELAEEYLDAHGIASMLDAPIRKSGRVAGVLCFEHTGAPREWSLVDQCGAASMASLLARGLETRDRLRVEESLQRAKKSEALGRVAGQIAHDFHNRLTVLGLLVDQLAQEQTPHEMRETIRHLVDEVTRAREQVRRLLDVNRPVELAPEAVELGAAITAELPNLRRIAGGMKLHLQSSAAPLLVALSIAELREMLTNLVTNARDAQHEDGRCTIHLRREASERGAEARILVEDSGTGFSAEAEAHLFEPFFTTKPGTRGSGLGLSSVQDVVVRAGGTVVVHSRAGQGSQVEIRLPLTATA